MYEDPNSNSHYTHKVEHVSIIPVILWWDGKQVQEIPEGSHPVMMAYTVWNINENLSQK